jgi:hypothetical protein
LEIKLPPVAWAHKKTPVFYPTSREISTLVRAVSIDDVRLVACGHFDSFLP